MSHYDTLVQSVFCREEVVGALNTLGIQVVENDLVRGYQKGERVAIVGEYGGKYNLGFKEVEGGFVPHFDAWALDKDGQPNLMNQTIQQIAITKTLQAQKQPGLTNANVRMRMNLEQRVAVSV